MSPSEPAGTIVVATRDRARILPGTLEKLLDLPERWPVIVVDNDSSDGTGTVVRHRFPEVDVVSLDENLGAGARNVGVARARTELVAFADDDSWWEPGALATAARRFADHPRLGLLAGCCIVEPSGEVDPVSAAQVASPLPPTPAGPSILGFLACTAVVRRRAFLGVGGFHPVIGIMGEEDVLAMDLRAAGWQLAHAADVVVHHEPGQVTGHRNGRRALQLRNRVLSHWLRRPLTAAVTATAELVGAAPTDPDARRALAGVALRLPAALIDRRPVPADVEAEIRTLDEAAAEPSPRELPP